MNSSQLSLAALVIANLFFLIMAAVQEWGYSYILICLWLETLIIGFYNVGRIFIVCLYGQPLGKWVAFKDDAARVMFSIFLNGFFVFKFGGFLLATGVLVIAAPAVIEDGRNADGIVAVADAFQALGRGALLVAVALFFSHGISFFMNFIKQREYQRSGIITLLFWPYARLLLIFAVIIFGFQAVNMVPFLARTPLFTVIVIVLKLLVDMVSHRYEHREKKEKLPVNDHSEKQ